MSIPSLPLPIQPIFIPFIVVIVGFLIAIIYLMITHSKTKKNMEFKVRESQRQKDFECPRCGAHVDEETSVCPECNAEFEVDAFACPVCDTIVSKDAEECPECGEAFIIEKKGYECPECGTPVDKFDQECFDCGATFWSPVRRSGEDLSPSGEEEGKIELHRVEIEHHDHYIQWREDVEEENEDEEGEN